MKHRKKDGTLINLSEMSELQIQKTIKDGTLINLSEMSDHQLQNTIRLIERKAKEGIEVEIEVKVLGLGPFWDGIWDDVTTLMGSEALDRMKYHEYIEEMERRKKA